jgi:hypothetical protein
MELLMLSYASTNADLERELAAGETLLWSGRPKQGLLLRASDALFIPFSLLWGGFALFWETGVLSSGAPLFFAVWGIPFLIVAAYITLGRFFVDAYTHSKTSYGVTNQRVLIIAGLLGRTVKSLPLQNLGELALRRRADGSGTITFGPGIPFAAWYHGFAWPGMHQRLPPTFELIPDAQQVYDLIRQAQFPR